MKSTNLVKIISKASMRRHESEKEETILSLTENQLLIEFGKLVFEAIDKSQIPPIIKILRRRVTVGGVEGLGVDRGELLKRIRRRRITID